MDEEKRKHMMDEVQWGNQVSGGFQGTMAKISQDEVIGMTLLYENPKKEMKKQD